MLIATPYRDFEMRDKSPPKVISEIRKSYGNCAALNFGPKMTGDLLVKCGNDRNWWPRRIHIRGGQLLVSSSTHGAGPLQEEKLPSIRLPLRHLSLQAGPLPNSLALSKGQNIVLTIQATNENNFDDWVKTIAIELIRQTPIDAIKYLDILTIAACWNRIKTPNNHKKDCNSNNVDTKNEPKMSTSPRPCESCLKNQADEKTVNPNKKNETDKPLFSTSGRTSNNIIKEKDVEDLLKKCQNAENYVPVKDKLFLFETLCKVGRKVRSTEDVSLRNVETSETKRARSMHDLSNMQSHIAVREICKYFENKTENISSNNNFNNNKSDVSDIHHSNNNYNCKKTGIFSNNNNYKRLLPVKDQINLNDIYKFRKVITT